MNYDCLVLGAGMVGVSTALHLQKSGRSVALVDRRPAAEETSYGNAGVIQSEAVLPYPFPRDLGKILTYAFNRSPEANLHWSALPEIGPWLYRYWRHGTRERIERTARAALPLIERCLAEHEELMQEAGIAGMIRRDGYLKIYRDERMLQSEIEAEQDVHDRFGINYEAVDATGLKELEPHLTGSYAGGILLTDPASVADPGAVGKAYAELFQSLGGTFLTADARTLEAVSEGWQVQNVKGPIVARDCVIALGPWSGEILRLQGVTVPLVGKRGYHVHFRAEGNATLTRPVLDTEFGYVLAPMRQDIRLTTGAEFARMSAPPTPVQLDAVEPIARRAFPLAACIEETPWMGRRPCLPDMLAMIGGVPGSPGLWANFGHHHLGFTLGPVTGRLLAQMITQQPTFCDIHPYRVDRF